MQQYKLASPPVCKASRMYEVSGDLSGHANGMTIIVRCFKEGDCMPISKMRGDKQEGFIPPPLTIAKLMMMIAVIEGVFVQ